MAQEDMKITYKQNIPYYKGMPCFVNGMRLNSHPRVDKEGFLSAYYWRDGGLWGCKVSEIYPNVCKQVAYIRYVHELQHLLFGLRINSEMEVQIV